MFNLKRWWHKPVPVEVPVISEESKKDPVVIEWQRRVKEFYSARRSTYDSMSTFDKYCFIRGINFDCYEDCERLYRKLGNPDIDIHIEFRLDKDLLAANMLIPDERPTEDQLMDAQLFYEQLVKTVDTDLWDNTPRVFYNGYDIDAMEHYLRSQYGLFGYDLSVSAISYIWWCLVGKPKGIRCFTHVIDACRHHGDIFDYYYDSIRKAIRLVENWAGFNLGCCDFPDELEPGTSSLYAHKCRFKRPEVKQMTKVKEIQPTPAKYITLVCHNAMEANVTQKQWYAITTAGKFPIKAGGEPENVDVLVRPFYRFTNDRPEGHNVCVIGVSSGMAGHRWNITISESMDILSICDSVNGCEMEGITIPLDSPVLDLFRIECPLNYVFDK